MSTQKLVAVAMLLFIPLALLAAQEKKQEKKKTGPSDAQYSAQALSAAPSAVSKDASVVRMDADGKMRTLREGKNGYTCMVGLGSPMCADENSMAFFGAWMKHENPPEGKAGITYMLRGDTGASNTDPFATKKTADNHWVMTGAHIMVVGPGAKAMGLPDSADADPTKPYLMWAGTPYEHAMIPVASSKPAAKAPAAAAEKSKTP